MDLVTLAVANQQMDKPLHTIGLMQEYLAQMHYVCIQMDTSFHYRY